MELSLSPYLNTLEGKDTNIDAVTLETKVNSQAFSRIKKNFP